MRLNQFLARAGIASRRGADELIAEGKVLVNGQVAVVGLEVDPEKDKIEIGRRGVRLEEGTVYLMLNKPRGYTTTVQDRFAGRTVMTLLPKTPRIFPIGRLDRDSEGLLLFTNDGDFANALMHPRYHVAKTYHVWVQGELTDAALSRLSGGIPMEEGVAKAKVRVIRQEKENMIVEFVLYQGFNRQIRRMCSAVGLQVKKLVRMKVGEVVLGDLPRGVWRYLSPKEVESLKSATASR